MNATVRLTEQGHVKCACCTRNAVRVVGATLQIASRHDGQSHITTLSIVELIQLLDKSGVTVAQ